MNILQAFKMAWKSIAGKKGRSALTILSIFIGIAAVMTADDNYVNHIDDTLKAGAGLCNVDAVKVLVEEGPENIRTLIDMQIPFDVNSEGDLQITREGGHRMRRIVHCGGDPAVRAHSPIYPSYDYDTPTKSRNCLRCAV